MSESKDVRVLFVCLGNICRSPIAHGVFEHKVARAGLASKIDVDSCGTSSYHVGEQPDPGSIAVCRSAGIDITNQRSRQLKNHDFEGFDLLIAMDRSNLSNMKRMGPASAIDRLHLFRGFHPDAPRGAEVPDPWGGGTDGFRTVYDIVDSTTDHLLSWVCERYALKSDT